MALPKKLKHFNLFGNGDNWQGMIGSLTLPRWCGKWKSIAVAA